MNLPYIPTLKDLLLNLPESDDPARELELEAMRERKRKQYRARKIAAMQQRLNPPIIGDAS